MALPYDIEERVEDAFVKYLSLTLDQSVAMKVLAAYDTNKVQYPCAVVKAGKAEKIDPKGAWSTSRKIEVEIGILVEAVKLVDDEARVVAGARDVNRACRSAVISALSIEDTDAGPADFMAVCQCDSTDKPNGLAAYLTYQKIDGIWIKFAQMLDSERDVEGDKRCLTTLIKLVVIAQPVQIGGY